jgi:hypothetical protein
VAVPRPYPHAVVVSDATPAPDAPSRPPDDPPPPIRLNAADLPFLGIPAAFGYASRVGLTMQNTNTAITVAGDALPTRPVGSPAAGIEPSVVVRPVRVDRRVDRM